MNQWRELRLLRQRLWIKRGRPLVEGTHPLATTEEQREAERRRVDRMRVLSQGGAEGGGGAGGRRGRSKRWSRPAPPPPPQPAWKFQRETLPR